MIMKTKKSAMMAVSLASLLFAPSVFASLYDGSLSFPLGLYESGSGGEFKVVTSSLGTFQTFCLEQHEDIAYPPTGPYDYVINSGAVQGGGVAGGANAIDPHTGLTMDNLSIGTAWLYSQFRAGTLANYFSANRTANAGVLQNAFWELEGELPYDANNTYIAAARTALSLTDAQLQLDSNGAYGVVALNLFNGPYSQQVWSPALNQYVYLNQDMLAVVPEPATMLAGALLLLPFGASTIRILRRKQ